MLLLEPIETNDDQHTEYMSSFSDAVIETFVVFDITGGVKVLVSVDDMGFVVNSFKFGQETLQKLVNETSSEFAFMHLKTSSAVGTDTAPTT